MHETQIERWTHRHTFGTQAVPRGEARTRWVIGLTLVMMVVEIAAGWAFGSMALLADGWHMGTHAAALSVTAFAYLYMRRHAEDPRYSFGTGKVGSLGGFASAVALAVVAVLVFGESTWRLTAPVAIHFDYAIGVAVVGLVVNLASALILSDHHHDHAEPGGHHHHDHNLRAAYLHVLADALTSLLAIVALSAGKFLGWMWTDPVMGIVGSVVIARWSLGLLRQTSVVLLDGEVDAEQREAIRSLIEADGDNRVADLHVWRVGPSHLAAIVSVVTHEPKAPDHYKALMAGRTDLVHLTVEVHRCPEDRAA
ncbi:MAG: CDF family Co(II)/Ni(II) efflux transporter DmeF [Myxococcota bacterium]